MTDRLRMLEREALADERAAVVPGHGEALVAQLVHQREDVGGHGPLAEV